jgi:hypothetical protein
MVTSRESLTLNNLGKPCHVEERTPHLLFANCVSFGKLLPLNLNFFIHKVIVVVAVMKCSSK